MSHFTFWKRIFKFCDIPNLDLNRPKENGHGIGKQIDPRVDMGSVGVVGMGIYKIGHGSIKGSSIDRPMNQQ